MFSVHAGVQRENPSWTRFSLDRVRRFSLRSVDKALRERTRSHVPQEAKEDAVCDDTPEDSHRRVLCGGVPRSVLTPLGLGVLQLQMLNFPARRADSSNGPTERAFQAWTAADGWDKTWFATDFSRWKADRKLILSRLQPTFPTAVKVRLKPAERSVARLPTD